MPAHLPIACSLVPVDFRAREATIAGLGRDALVHADLSGTCAELRFTAAPGIRERVERFVADETRCCAFLTMHVTEGAEALRLVIDAPDDAEPVLAELVHVFGPERVA